jgi:hypothetical protein
MLLGKDVTMGAYDAVRPSLALKGPPVLPDNAALGPLPPPRVIDQLVDEVGGGAPPLSRCHLSSRTYVRCCVLQGSCYVMSTAVGTDVVVYCNPAMERTFMTTVELQVRGPR